MLSSPPVHSLVPSWDMSIQLAPSVWPWNCLKDPNQPEVRKRGQGYLIPGNKKINKSCPDLTRVWLWRSHTAMFPSEQQEKHTLASGLMASA